MQKLNLSKNEIAAFDIDAQQTFTPLCPDELPNCPLPKAT